jgi:dihydrolipoamide dehydrogenase
MERRNVDVAVIGAGTAGLGALRAARAHTENVVLIEGGTHGTTCARVGCMPSKLLIAAAEAAHAAREAPVFGVHPGAVRVDGRAVMDRVRSERDRFVGFVLDSVEAIPPALRLTGRARFLDPQHLQVDDHTTIEAARIVIATGSRPDVPPLFAGLGERVVVNDDVFEWKDLPESVAVVGSGVIGVELGQALHRLGVRVRIFDRSGGVGPLSDPGVREVAARVIAAELAFESRAVIEAAEPRDDGIVLRFRDAAGASKSERFERVLVATGRRPNLDTIGLSNAGLALDARGVPLHDRHTGQCGTSHVFLAGDASAERAILHEAVDEGRIAGDNAGRFPDVRCQPRRAPLAIVFSDPQIALAGATHRELLQRRADFAIGAVSFDDQGRSRVMNQHRGLLHVYGEHGTGLLLGAEMIAPRAEHLGHLLAWAVQRQLTIPELLEMPFYHPVVEEGLRSALRDLNHELRIGPEPVPRCIDCGPGA